MKFLQLKNAEGKVLAANSGVEDADVEAWFEKAEASFAEEKTVRVSKDEIAVVAESKKKEVERVNLIKDIQSVKDLEGVKKVLLAMAEQFGIIEPVLEEVPEIEVPSPERPKKEEPVKLDPIEAIPAEEIKANEREESPIKGD